MASQRVLTVLVTLFAITLHAQVVQPDLRVLTTRDGLSHGQVLCMAKDQRERLWVGTRSGLNRFDGRHFKVYRHDPDNDRSIACDAIRSMAIDSSGLLYVATEAAYLTILDTRADTLVNVPLPPDHRTSQDEHHVHSIIKDGKGRIWFTHGTDGLSWLDADRHIVHATRLPIPEGTPEGRRGTGRIFIDGAGTFWIAMYKGLVRFDPATGVVNLVRLHPLDGQPAAHCTYQTGGFVDEDSTLLLGTFGEGIYRMRKQDGGVVRLWPSAAFKPTYVDHMVGDLLRMEDGKVLVATIDQGILRLDPVTGKVEHFDRSLEPDRCRDVRDLFPAAWCFHRDGPDVWVGSSSGGLALWSARKNRHRGFALPVADAGVRNEFVLSLTRDAMTGRWLALTNERGLFVYESDGSYVGHFGMPVGKGRYRAQHVTTTGDGKAWIATDRHLLLADVRELRLLPLPFVGDGSACSGWLWWTVPDHRGGLWCFASDGRLAHLDLHTGACDPLTERFPKVSPWLKGPILHAEVDGNDRLWLALRDTFSIVVLPEGNVVQVRGTQKDLRLNRFAETANGTMLAASQDHGVVAISIDPTDVVTCSAVAGSRKGEATDVLAFGDGSFWFEDRMGLVHVEAGGANVVSISAADGIPGVDWHLEHSSVPLVGPCLAGTWEGFLLLDPEVLQAAIWSPSVQVPQFLAGDSLVARDADAAQVLYRVLHDRDRVVFELRTTNLLDPQRDLLAYRLIGLDTSWSELSLQERITFSNLAPGHYQLEVHARTNGGPWGAVTRIPFIILPPFWATWWFRIAFVLVVSLLAWLVFRAVLKGRLRRQRVLMEREHAVLEERIRIAHDLHDDLGSGLATIGMESDLAVLEANDPLAREALRRVSQEARNVGDDMRRIVWALGSGQESLGDLVAYVRAFAGELLDHAGIVFELQLSVHEPDLWLSADQRRHLLLFTKEVLTNVVRHAEAEQVLMRIAQKDGRLEWSIQDDGRGFEADARSGEGTGSTSMRARAKALGGLLDVRSAPGKGTAVVLNLPLVPTV